MRDLLLHESVQRNFLVNTIIGTVEGQLLPPPPSGYKWRIYALTLSLEAPAGTLFSAALVDDNTDCPFYLSLASVAHTPLIWDGGFDCYRPGQATPDIATGALHARVTSADVGFALFSLSYAPIELTD